MDPDKIAAQAWSEMGIIRGKGHRAALVAEAELVETHCRVVPLL